MNNAKQYFRIEPWKSVRALKLQLLGLNYSSTSTKKLFEFTEVTTMNNAKLYFRIEPWKSVRALKLQLLGLND